jgi:hypothetical protein
VSPEVFELKYAASKISLIIARRNSLYFLKQLATFLLVPWCDLHFWFLESKHPVSAKNERENEYIV